MTVVNGVGDESQEGECGGTEREAKLRAGNRAEAKGRVRNRARAVGRARKTGREWRQN